MSLKDLSVVKEHFENKEMGRRLNQFFSRLPNFLIMMVVSEYQHFKAYHPDEEPYFIIKCHRKYKKQSRSDSLNWRPPEDKPVNIETVTIIDETGVNKVPVNKIKPIKMTIKHSKTDQVVNQKIITDKVLNKTHVLSEKIIENRQIIREVLHEEIITNIDKIDGEIIVYRCPEVVDESKDIGCETDVIPVREKPTNDIQARLLSVDNKHDMDNGTSVESIEYVKRILKEEYGKKYNLVNIIIKAINDNRMKVATRTMFKHSFEYLENHKKYANGTPFLSKMCDLLIHQEAHIKYLTNNEIYITT
jgi:hypothetical protein